MKQVEICFGTDGWRGVIDEDFNETNVRLVARAVAEYLHHAKPEGHGVLVGYDNRLKSEVFARAAAEEPGTVWAAHRAFGEFAVVACVVVRGISS